MNKLFLYVCGVTTLIITQFLVAPDVVAIRGGFVITGATGVVEIRGCTGQMISPNTILTAAHCVDSFSSSKVKSGRSTFTIYYHDPKLGRRLVYYGEGDWYRHRDYTGSCCGAGPANTDISIVRTLKPFKNTDYHDYLRLYADGDNPLYTWLTAYGAGKYTYSGNGDDKLRTAWFRVESVAKNHIVVDNRDDVNLCKGDSGGPLEYLTTYGEEIIPLVAGVASNTERDSSDEACAGNSWGFSDDTFYSRTNWEKLSSLMATANISCSLMSINGIAYRRCFNIPLIEDIEWEGYTMEEGVAMMVVISP